MSSNPARDFYDRISSAYDAIADAGERKARERGLAALAASPGEHVLEVGFGTGHNLVALAKAVSANGASGQVQGVDISEGMLKVAQKRIEEAGLTNIELMLADVPPLPQEDGRFDAVTMSFTLELFPLETIPQVLAECRRVLQPGGRLGIVSMAKPLPSEKDSLLEKTYVWMHQHFPHIVDCQPIEAERLVQEAGFDLVTQERMTIWTMPVAVLVGRKPE